VLADLLDGTRANPRHHKARGIRFAEGAVATAEKVTKEKRKELKQPRERRREEYFRRIPIEGKFR